MGIDMTDRKAGRARKRAFNLEHGRYNVGRKAARTTRDWDTWNEARKNAYTQRKKYDMDTVAMDLYNRRELIIKASEQIGLVLKRMLGKSPGRQRQPHGTGRKVNQMHQLQSLLIRKRELWTNWVNSTTQGHFLSVLK